MTKLRLLPALVVAIWALGSSPASADPGPDVNVSDLAGNEAEVSIDINPTNLSNQVIVGHAPGFATMNTFYSFDRGKTWDLVSLGDADDGHTSNFRFDPTVAFDADGNVYAGYGVKELTAPGEFQTTVVVCKSADGGQTYQCEDVDTTANINSAESGAQCANAIDDVPVDGFVNDGCPQVGDLAETAGQCSNATDDDLADNAAGTGEHPPGPGPIRVNDGCPAKGGELPGNDKWHLATGPDPVNAAQENVYITWTQNVPEMAGTDQRIVASGSTDGGANWSAPVIVNDPSIAGTSVGNLYADPAVGPGGELYVAWQNLNTNMIYVDDSADGGATFGADNTVTASVADVGIPPQPDRGGPGNSNIDVDRSGGAFNGRLYVTYVDGAPPDTNVRVRYSDDDGASWSGGTLVNDDGGTKSQFLPWVDVDQTMGFVVVVWYDARNDANNQKVELFLGFSEDGGDTFEPNILVSDGQSDQSVGNGARWSNNYLEYIGVAARACLAFPAWSDNSLDPADLDFFTDEVQIPCGGPPVVGGTVELLASSAEPAAPRTEADGTSAADVAPIAAAVAGAGVALAAGGWYARRRWL